VGREGRNISTIDERKDTKPGKYSTGLIDPKRLKGVAAKEQSGRQTLAQEGGTKKDPANGRTRKILLSYSRRV